jgi:hypothetical protein
MRVAERRDRRYRFGLPRQRRAHLLSAASPFRKLRSRRAPSKIPDRKGRAQSASVKDAPMKAGVDDGTGVELDAKA